MGSDDSKLGVHVKSGLTNNGPLDRALFDDLHEGISILLRKAWRELHLQIDPDQLALRVEFGSLENSNLLVSDASLSAKTLNEDSSARSD